MRFRNITHGLLDGVGCVGSVLIIILPVIIIGIVANKCEKKERKPTQQEIIAYRDSVERANQLYLMEIDEHRTKFYNAFRKHYDFFESDEDFSDWVVEADYEAMELLHYLFSLNGCSTNPSCFSNDCSVLISAFRFI